MTVLAPQYKFNTAGLYIHIVSEVLTSLNSLSCRVPFDNFGKNLKVTDECQMALAGVKERIQANLMTTD